MNLRSAIRLTIHESDLPIRDRLILRLAMLVPSQREKIEQTLLQSLSEEQLMPSGADATSSYSELDWAAILEVLKVLLPLILALFK